MRSLNKAIIGVLAATAMIAGPFGTASAEEVTGTQTTPTGEVAASAATSDQSLAPAAAAANANDSSKTPDAESASAATQAAKPEASKEAAPSSAAQPSTAGKSEDTSTSAATTDTTASSPKTSEPSQSATHTAQPTPAPQVEQHPQAQDLDYDNCTGSSVWGGGSGASGIPFTFVPEAGGCSVHFGSGTGFGGLEDGPFADKDKITHIVFEGPVSPGSNSTSMLFSGFPNLTAIDGLHNLNMTGVTVATSMFHGDPKLERIDAAGWDVSQVTDMEWMFVNDYNLKSIDVTGWSTSRVEDMENMFAGDGALTEIKGVSDFDTSQVENMSGLFNRAGLRSLDLSSWVTSNVTDLGNAFSYMPNLESIDVASWDVSSVTSMFSLFGYDTKLTSVSVKEWHPDALETAWGMFGAATALTSLDFSGWKGHTSNLENLSMMFNCNGTEGSQLKSLTGLDGWDVSNVSDTSYMFANLPNLSEINLKGWNLAPTDSGLYQMFYHDASLTKIDGLKSFDTSQAENITEMFAGDRSLTQLNLSGWDTRNVTDGNNALPPYLNKVELGPNTQLQADYFSYEQPSAAGAEETSGYTGRWAKSDDTWTSDASDDDGTFSALTSSPEFAGGTYRWQEFAEMIFDANAPAGVSVTGTTATIRKVGADASNIKIRVPGSAFGKPKGYTFDSWNVSANGAGRKYLEGEVAENFTRGGSIKLYAQWTRDAVPTPPAPKPSSRYTIRYKSNAPAGLEVTGSVADDTFEVTPAPGVDLNNYERAIKANGYTISDYTFVGWNTDPDANGKSYQPGDQIKVAPGVTVLYAQWRATSVPITPVKPLRVNYTIRYVANAPKGLTATGSVKDDTFEVTPAPGVNLRSYPRAVQENAYKVSGYAFAGWNVKPDVNKGNYQKGDQIKVAPGVTVLYAQWRATSVPITPVKPLRVNYTIRYVANAPKGLTATGSVKDDTFEVTPAPGVNLRSYPRAVQENAYKVSGYAFAGWNVKPDVNKGNYQKGDQIKVAPGVTVLYAQWEKIPVAPLPSVVATPIAPVSTLPAAPAPLATRSAPAAAPPASVTPAATAAPRANTNVVAAPAVAPAVPSQQQPQAQPARPKCIPENVYRKIQANKRGTKPISWIEYGDGTMQADPAAWKLSDYKGLARCEVEASAPAAMNVHMNFWWMLLFLIPLLLLALRNNNAIVARHRNLDSATISKRFLI
ncbi:BspA family leucine-rich repeat surface protein [Bifidobacterium sp. ESL0728]|uniref:BspA family leucine-rich repeat surface protein n=1 Tax=Bifidobacterium sp. ESL0728 TaxID=2983220 RepID=UPI0023F96BF9|nr:BspA family leucine-rich repeat surface protein [Bifidobacterium sp. ESL0728]WEV58955.1 BspA family leucine-rich repeat surface protein [Bifidobacterium sp. ESL0728]